MIAIYLGVEMDQKTAKLSAGGTSDYFVEEYSQMSVSHIDAFQSKTNNKC